MSAGATSTSETTSYAPHPIDLKAVTRHLHRIHARGLVGEVLLRRDLSAAARSEDYPVFVSAPPLADEPLIEEELAFPDVGRVAGCLDLLPDDGNAHWKLLPNGNVRVDSGAGAAFTFRQLDSDWVRTSLRPRKEKRLLDGIPDGKLLWQTDWAQQISAAKKQFGSDTIEFEFSSYRSAVHVQQRARHKGRELDMRNTAKFTLPGCRVPEWEEGSLIFSAIALDRVARTLRDFGEVWAVTGLDKSLAFRTEGFVYGIAARSGPYLR